MSSELQYSNIIFYILPEGNVKGEFIYSSLMSVQNKSSLAMSRPGGFACKMNIAAGLAVYEIENCNLLNACKATNMANTQHILLMNILEIG